MDFDEFNKEAAKLGIDNTTDVGNNLNFVTEAVKQEVIRSRKAADTLAAKQKAKHKVLAPVEVVVIEDVIKDVVKPEVKMNFDDFKQTAIDLGVATSDIIKEAKKLPVKLKDTIKVIVEEPTKKATKTVKVSDIVVEAIQDEVKITKAAASDIFDGPINEMYSKVTSKKTKTKLNKEAIRHVDSVADYIQTKVVEEADKLEFDPASGDANFQKEMVQFKTTIAEKIKSMFTAEVNNFRRIAEMSSGGGGNESRSIQNATDIATLSADVGAFENVTTNQREQFQGYIALLSPVYFGGAATIANIAIGDINTWLDIELAVDPAGAFDHRVTSMKTAQAQGYTGTGANADPIIFLLEGLELTSSADVRVSMSFNPDEDGGRLNSRLNFFRHSGTTPSDNFHIEASALSMESGAEEDYSYTPDIKFFVGDTIDTNAAGDAGRVCFQIKSDVPGTVTLNEIAMFIQK